MVVSHTKLPDRAAFVGVHGGSHAKQGPFCRNFQIPDDIWGFRFYTNIFPNFILEQILSNIVFFCYYRAKTFRKGMIAK